MRELVPACPPGAFPSIITTFRPSDAAYTAAPRPAGPAPTMQRAQTAGRAVLGFNPGQAAASWTAGLRSTWGPRQSTTGVRPPAARGGGGAGGGGAPPQNQEDLGRRFARFAEAFARLGFAVPAMRFDAGDLRGRQSWKSLRLSGGLGRGCWSSWGGGHDLNTIPQGKSFRHGPTMQASRAGSRRPAQNA